MRRTTKPAAKGQTRPRSSKGRFARAGIPPHAPLRGQRAGRPADSRPASSAVLDQIERSADTGAEIRELVATARAGDELAFAELYIRFFDRVYRYLLAGLKNRDDAQEVAQEVFVRALRMLDRFDPERGEFRSWLFSMVRSLAIDRSRRRSRREQVDLDAVPRHAVSVAEHAASLIERLDPGEGVRSLVDGLPELQRWVLTLRFVFDLNTSEIADVMGSSPDAVRHLQHRALKALAARTDRESA